MFHTPNWLKIRRNKYQHWYHPVFIGIGTTKYIRRGPKYETNSQLGTIRAGDINSLWIG